MEPPQILVMTIVTFVECVFWGVVRIEMTFTFMVSWWSCFLQTKHVTSCKNPPLDPYYENHHFLKTHHTHHHLDQFRVQFRFWVWSHCFPFGISTSSLKFSYKDFWTKVQNLLLVILKLLLMLATIFQWKRFKYAYLLLKYHICTF
jgi:hypothetical protein